MASQFIPYMATGNNINDVPIVPGQFIFHIPTGIFYLDLDENTRQSAYTQLTISDVLTYDTYANFPATGELIKLYVDATNQRIYRWDNTQNRYEIITTTPDDLDIYTKTEMDAKMVNIVHLMEAL